MPSCRRGPIPGVAVRYGSSCACRILDARMAHLMLARNIRLSSRPFGGVSYERDLSFRMKEDEAHERIGRVLPGSK